MAHILQLNPNVTIAAIAPPKAVPIMIAIFVLAVATGPSPAGLKRPAKESHRSI